MTKLHKKRTVHLVFIDDQSFQTQILPGIVAADSINRRLARVVDQYVFHILARAQSGFQGSGIIWARVRFVSRRVGRLFSCKQF